MSMRRPEARAKRPVHLEVSEFGWSPSVIATLRHSSLPWNNAPTPAGYAIEGLPLSGCRTSGKRDALSLTGQYSAHLAWLRFCGLSDSSFVPEDWIVDRRRGEDCRLIRIRAPQGSSFEEFVPLTLLQAFSEYVGSPKLEIFRQSSAKPEAVYHEVHRRLREEPPATTTWARRAAGGVVLAPGPLVLERMLSEPYRYKYDDSALIDAVSCAQSLHGGGRYYVMGGLGTSPLVPWSAASEFRSLVEAFGGDAGRVAEEILESAQSKPIAIAVTRIETFDAVSRNLVAILLDHPESIGWFLPDVCDPLFTKADAGVAEPSRYFVISPRLEPLKQVRSTLEGIEPSRRRNWISAWVESEPFSAFLEDGVIDFDSEEWKVEEPAKSYISALALMGDALDEELCRDFLSRLGCHVSPSEMCGPGVLEVSGGLVRFSSSECRRHFARGVPQQTRAALCALAASLLESSCKERAVELYILAGDREKARSILERDGGGSVQSWEDTLTSMSMVPEEVLRGSAILSARLCRALISAGQYRRAEGFADALEEHERQLLLARIARRRGMYRAALALIGPAGASVSAGDFERLLLTGELFRLTGDSAQAGSCFELCRSVASSAEDLAMLAFEEAMLRLDEGSPPGDESIKAIPHLELRLDAYKSLIELDYPSARAYAEAALRIAHDVPARIDASLDLMNAHFLAGQWDEARYRAREALALVEETEGDRGSGGILFLLAYLCADEGQWKQAREKIDRLRRFYSGTGDEARLGEVDLIVAHLALADGDSKSARQTAAGLIAGEVPHDIREAAALIVDEANWMEGSLEVLCSTGKTECLELRDWHLTQRSRVSGKPERGIVGEVWRQIVTTELDPVSPITEVEPSAGRSQKLRMLRSAIGLTSLRSDPALHRRIRDLSGELGCSSVGESSPVDTPSRAVEVMHQLAAHEFPFGSMKVAGLDWRYASRNRLGVWNQAGSLEPLAAEALEQSLAEPSGSWMATSDRAVLFVEGMDLWPAASKQAVGSLMTLRAEHQALRNLLAEEERGTIADAPVALGIVGDSPAIREVTEKISRLSRSEAVICILGESGTGKELVARSIHKQSPRRGRTFTPINCAALPDALVESELFGHVRGAYTGADRDHAGLIESSEAGTLFLDEIGELPLPAQSKLLRFLQEGEYRRVGDTAVRRADVRIIAATNRELEKAVDEGRFREDLFYRINVIEIRVPPLRERGGDIVLLAKFFLEQERARQRTGPEKFTDDVELVLQSHNWPGNVRELQNAVKASFAIAGDSRRIGLDHLPERLRGVQIRNAATGSYFEELNRFRKSLVEQSLVSASGNQNQAAKLLGISRQALAYQIRELGILVKDPARRGRLS